MLVLAVASCSPALAQSSKGAFGVDAMLTPTTGLGFAYYVTDGLSVRPWLSVGYSDMQGFFGNVGGQVRYEFGTGWTISPYVSGSAQYVFSETTPLPPPGAAGSPALAEESSGGQLGAGAGLRFRLGESLSLFSEGRVFYTTYPSYARAGWSTFEMGTHTRGEVVFGVTYLIR
jgi:hypothetical protein